MSSRRISKVMPLSASRENGNLLVVNLGFITPTGGCFFYWKGLKDDVVNYVEKCDVFQKSKYDHSAYQGLFIKHIFKLHAMHEHINDGMLPPSILPSKSLLKKICMDNPLPRIYLMFKVTGLLKFQCFIYPDLGTKW
ncbi:hypothetical protein KY284_007566 [Solanum tuberosum]|nr:hypothetical protein KY284_007566 [Solanum tuberosum]